MCPSFLCLASCVLLSVKIGKIFRQFFNQKRGYPLIKIRFFKIFLTALLTSSYENPESEIEDFFRIKSAGSSNYRGSVFLLPEFTRVYPRVYLHGSSAGECVLTCFGVYPREPLTWPITGGRGLFFRLRQKDAKL